jgi:hypothetical protein
MTTIEKDIQFEKTYYIPSDIFVDLSEDEIRNILKTNIKFSITDLNKNDWCTSNIISDVRHTGDKIFFRPANILREIILNSKNSPKHSYLKYVMFNGIRYKQTLLFLDYILHSKKNNFTLTIEEFKTVVELKIDQYKNYNALRSSVLDRILLDINEKTNYHLKITDITKSKGRKVIGLIFDYYDKGLGKI